MQRYQYTHMIFGLMAVMLFLVSCTRTGGDLLQTPEAAIFWPPGPAQSRIQFIRSFSRPEDLGITKGVFQRIGELLAGSFEPHLVRPMAVVSTFKGVLYVADPGSNGIHRFDLAKGRYNLIRGEGGKPLPSPVGLAVGLHGELYIVDSLLGQLFVVTPTSKVATPVLLKVKPEQPTAVALDPTTEQLYVVDTKTHQIKVFGVDGTLRFTFGQRGNGDGEFNYPTAIWRDNAGHLFITDSLNFRIQIFDEKGQFLGKFGQIGDATGDFSRPKGVATDRFGHIYVVDSLFHAVQIFDLSNNFLLSFGSQGQGPGEFWLPTGIFIGAHETIYVADSHNQRIQVFRYIGDQP